MITRAIDFQAPQLVTIVGNQGTGKTRLINELITAIGATKDRPCRVFHGAAEHDAAGAPVRLSALMSLLRDRFDLTPHADEVAKLRFSHEIRTVMGTDQVAEMLHFIGAYVGLEFPPTPFLRAVAENPKQHQEIARTALRRFIELDAANSPLVLVLDDMQWADRETLSLVNDLIVGLGGSRVVLLAAARPEMLVHTARVGRGRGRSRADRSAQPRARRRRADVPQSVVAREGHPRGHRRRPRSR